MEKVEWKRLRPWEDAIFSREMCAWWDAQEMATRVAGSQIPPYIIRAMVRQGVIRYIPARRFQGITRTERAIGKVRRFYKIGFMADPQIIRLFKVNHEVYRYMMAI
jgi:hypothetical protein